MSGHNKWAQIKRKKEVTDKKRSRVFSKLLRVISVAAKIDSNPQFNPSLRSAIEKAKEFNVPQENIERAIKKSSEVADIKSLIMEAYGPEGIALLIEAQTDNSNRTVAEIKKILSDHNGKWADPGSVLWAFTESEEGWRSTFQQSLSEEGERALLTLMEAVDDHDDVTDIHTNAIFTEDIE